jgi:hypothetical protein
VKQFGVGLSVAIAVDATIVRCLLVPARRDAELAAQMPTTPPGEAIEPAHEPKTVA